MIEFSPNAMRQYEEILARYPKKRAALIQVLALAQQEFGWISNEVAEYVGRLMGFPAADVLSVVSFYTMRHPHPAGKHHIEVCRNITCWMKGYNDILDEIKHILKIDVGEITQDGKFSLGVVECLGSCGTAPAMQVGDRYYENLTVEQVREIIEKLANG